MISSATNGQNLSELLYIYINILYCRLQMVLKGFEKVIPFGSLVSTHYSPVIDYYTLTCRFSLQQWTFVLASVEL